MEFKLASFMQWAGPVMLAALGVSPGEPSAATPPQGPPRRAAALGGPVATPLRGRSSPPLPPCSAIQERRSWRNHSLAPTGRLTTQHEPSSHPGIRARVCVHASRDCPQGAARSALRRAPPAWAPAWCTWRGPSSWRTGPSRRWRCARRRARRRRWWRTGPWAPSWALRSCCRCVLTRGWRGARGTRLRFRSERRRSRAGAWAMHPHFALSDSDRVCDCVRMCAGRLRGAAHRITAWLPRAACVCGTCRRPPSPRPCWSARRCPPAVPGRRRRRTTSWWQVRHSHPPPHPHPLPLSLSSSPPKHKRTHCKRASATQGGA